MLTFQMEWGIIIRQSQRATERYEMVQVPSPAFFFYLSRENSHLFQAVSNSKFVSVGVQSPAARLEYNKMIPVSPENYRYSFQGISNIILGIAELFLALNFVEKR